MTGAYQQPDDFEDQLTKARQGLRELAAAEGEAPEGIGAAADGLVTVTARSGRVATVTLDPRVMRRSAPDLAEAFTEAANAALADLASKNPVASQSSIDPAELEAHLERAQELGTRQMRDYLQSITDVAQGRG